MAHLYKDTGVKSLYSDRKFLGGKEGWQDMLQQSNTLYIGNLSFYTTEEQLYEFFGRCGQVRPPVSGGWGAWPMSPGGQRQREAWRR